MWRLLVRQAQGRIAVRHGPSLAQRLQTLAWIQCVAARAVRELVQDILKLNIVGFSASSQPALGWFKEDQERRTVEGLKYRTVGLAIDIMQAMGLSGAAAASASCPPSNGGNRGIRYNNRPRTASSAPRVSKHYIWAVIIKQLIFEIIFTRTIRVPAQEHRPSSSTRPRRPHR